MSLYVVIMYRFGNHENHSYLLGVYDSLIEAKHEATSEYLSRGAGKYYPHILGTKLNMTKDRTIIFDSEKGDILDFFANKDSKKRGCPTCNGADPKSCLRCYGKTRMCDWVNTKDGWYCNIAKPK